MSEHVQEPARQTPVVAEVDVLVCGGGPAGTCAAVAAARRGASTMLVEGSGVLGGAAVQALVLPLMTYHAAPDVPVVAGIGQEIVDRVVALGGSPGHVPDPLGCAATITPVDPEVLRAAVLETVVGAGVELRLHQIVVGTLVEDGAVRGVLVEGKAGRGAIRAKVVIDATGDADVAARGGAATVHGRAADGLAQPMSMMFRVAGVDGAAVRAAIREQPEDFVLSSEARARLDELPVLAVAGFFEAVKVAQAAGELGGFRDRVLYFELPRPGEVVVNMTRVTGISGVAPGGLTQGTVTGLQQVAEVMDFLRARVPGFAAAWLLQTASRVGVRETRHLEGRATLTAEDVLGGRHFEDGVARGGFPIDIHSPDGKGLQMQEMEPGTWYSIPYGCLVPRELGGLLVAGRAISASHEASASSRLSPTCQALGEAAGAAAALALRTGVAVADIDVGELRTDLAERGALV